MQIFANNKEILDTLTRTSFFTNICQKNLQQDFKEILNSQSPEIAEPLSKVLADAYAKTHNPKDIVNKSPSERKTELTKFITDINKTKEVMDKLNEPKVKSNDDRDDR